VRFAVLGGSAASTVQLVDAIANWPGGHDRMPEIELILHARSSDRLRALAATCSVQAVELGLDLHVVAEPDRPAALEGAHVILNQIRVGGLEGRSVDESLPRDFGLPGEETMGPGGFACAVRTIPALRPIWADIARYAPNSLVVNLTNPAGIVQQAARAEFELQIVSVCDSPVALLDSVAVRLGRANQEVRARYVGMNHVGWYLPVDLAELDSLEGLVEGIDPALPQLHEGLPTAYMRYYAHPDRVLKTQLGRPTRAEELMLIQEEVLGSLLGGTRSIPTPWKRQAIWYSLVVVPLVDAWFNGSAQMLVVGLPNRGRIPWLHNDAVIEGAISIPLPHKLEILPLPRVPEVPRALLAHHAAFEALTAKALLGNPTEEGLRRALLANPMVRSFDQARGLVDTIMRHAASGSV